MSISSLSLCLIFLTFLTTPLVLSSRTPKIAVAGSPSTEKKLHKTHVHPPALPVSESTEAVDGSIMSMAKIDAEPATNSAIAGFYRHMFPFPGWPFHKHGPFPTVKPANPSVTTTPATGAEEEESEKVPSSPSNGNRDGGNAGR